MNELQRQQYLDAMGIDTYMPRWILPGAKAPVACDVSFVPSVLEQPLQQSLQSTQPHSQPHIQQPSSERPLTSAHASDSPDPNPQQPSHAQPRSVLAVLTAAPQPQNAQMPGSPLDALAGLPGTDAAQPDALVADASQVSGPAVEFALSVWRISPELMVMDTRKAHLALPTEVLLQNILVALGYPPAPLVAAEVLRWPLLDSPFMGKSAADAREWLETFLETRLHAEPVKYLLLMGDASRYILPEGVTAQDCVELPQLGAQALVTAGLSDMLQNPLIKRDTWRIIQPLRIDRGAV